MIDHPTTLQSPSDTAIQAQIELKATPERVYAAWTQPEQFRQWFGPRKGTLQVDCFECAVGGRYDVVLLFDDGDRVRLDGEYCELDAPRRIVFTWHWTEGTDRGGDRSYETLVTINLAPSDLGTRLTLKHERFLTPDSRDDHGQGWTSMFDLLATYLGR